MQLTHLSTNWETLKREAKGRIIAITKTEERSKRLKFQLEQLSQ